MTLLTLSNFYAEDFLLHNIAVNRIWQLAGTEMTEASWGGELSFWRPSGEKIEGGGESKFSPIGRGEPSPLDTMIR